MTGLLRRVPQPVRDWAAPLVFAVIVCIDVATDPAFEGERVLGVVFAAPFALALGLRRRSALGALALCWGLCVAGSVVTESYFNLGTPFPMVMWSAYIAGTIGPLRDALLGVGCVLAGLASVNLTYPEAVAGDYLFPGGFILAMWAGSRAIRNRTMLAAELHEAAARAEERREEAEAEAVAEERRRIAREMHDLVGHSVSVMVVQAGGARRILERDPARAVEAAERIEETGRQALGEMRRLLGLLGPAEGDTLVPQPTLDQLEALVGRSRAAGLPVTFAVEGAPLQLPAGAEAAAYRVVQEALTNALKHAGAAPTEVLLRWAPEALEVTVANRGAATQPATSLPSGGHGLVGMRERVRVYGGTLTAEEDRGGGFVVHARLPTTQEGLVTA